MTITRITPPAEYLRTASQPSLETFELSKLNRAANLRREIATLIDQWLEETAQALLARYMIEHHSSLSQPSLSATELIQAFHDPLLPAHPDAPAPTACIVPAPPRFTEPQRRLTGTHGGERRK
jgi:hypothetical protein